MSLSLLVYKRWPDFCLRSATQKFWVVNLFHQWALLLLLKDSKFISFSNISTVSHIHSTIHIRSNLHSLILGTQHRWLRYEVLGARQDLISAVTVLAYPLWPHRQHNRHGLPPRLSSWQLPKSRSWRYPLDADPLIKWDNSDCFSFYG